MSGSYTVSIKGLDELQRNLEALPPKVGISVFRKGLNAGALIVRNAMVDAAPRYAGSDKSRPIGWLASHFGTRTRIIKQNIAGIIFIGPEGKIDYPDANVVGGFKEKTNSKGKKYNVGRVSVASVARFLEFGTRYAKKIPFMTQAWERVKAKVMDAIIDSIKAALAEVSH